MRRCCCFNCSSQASDEHQSNGRPHKRSSTSRPHSDLVKWQGAPIRSPLLRLPVELSALAIECFECILRYSGDLPQDPELTEVKCVYTILMVKLQKFDRIHDFWTLSEFTYCFTTMNSIVTSIWRFATKSTVNSWNRPLQIVRLIRIRVSELGDCSVF